MASWRPPSGREPLRRCLRKMGFANKAMIWACGHRSRKSPRFWAACMAVARADLEHFPRGARSDAMKCCIHASAPGAEGLVKRLPVITPVVIITMPARISLH